MARRLAGLSGPGILALLIVTAGCTGGSDSGGTAASTGGQPAEEAKEESAVIEAIDAFIAEQSIDKGDGRWKTRLAEPPEQSFDGGQDVPGVLEGSEKVVLRYRDQCRAEDREAGRETDACAGG